MNASARLLLLTLGLCLASSAPAQPILDVSQNPYDASGDTPLVLRNVQEEAILLDSIHISFYGSRGISFRYEAGGERHTWSGEFICFPYFVPFSAGCQEQPYDHEMTVLKGSMLAPGDSIALSHFTAWCPACKNGQAPLSADTLYLFMGGNSTPQPVVLNGMTFLSSDVPEAPSQVEVRVYPNPAREAVHVQPVSPARRITVRLYDVQGRLVMRADGSGASPVRLSLSQLSAGSYVVDVSVENDSGGHESTRRLLTVR